MSAGLTAHPMITLTVIAVAVAGAAMATVVATRGDGARHQQEALVAVTATALRSDAALDRWAATVAGDRAFAEPSDGSARHLFAAWRTDSLRTVAVDITLTDGRALCLVSTASNSRPQAQHVWHPTPCRATDRQPAPTPLSAPAGN